MRHPDHQKPSHLFLLPWDCVYIAARESNGPLEHIPSTVAQYGTSRCPKIDHIVHCRRKWTRFETPGPSRISQNFFCSLAILLRSDLARPKGLWNAPPARWINGRPQDASELIIFGENENVYTSNRSISSTTEPIAFSTPLQLLLYRSSRVQWTPRTHSQHGSSIRNLRVHKNGPR